jgi:predicted secreted protein
MPCPEFEVLGLDRAHLPIREELGKNSGRAQLRRMVQDVVCQIEAYQK